MPESTELQVSRSLVDIFAEPRFHAERISQAFWGELLSPLEEKNEFVRVRRIRDQYEGWVDGRYLVEKFSGKGNLHRLAVADADVKAQLTKQPLAPYRLLFGTEISVSKQLEQAVEFSVDAKHRGSIKKRALTPIAKPDPATAWKLILKHSRFFLGAPYLWGGISHLGCDCSGLVQTLYGQVGISLPRDTKDQRKIGMSVKRAEMQPGDLIFSPGHVVILLEKGKILHSSRAYGGVAIQSLDSRDDTYRKDIDELFEEARRVLPRRTTRAK